MKPLRKCIVVNGYPLSGKDAFVSMCRANLEHENIFTRSISSVDIIKDVATIMGWDGKKDSKSRKFLSDLKDLSTEYNDGPTMYMKKSIENIHKACEQYVIFLHIREPIEIAKFINLFPESLAVCIHRDESEKHHNNTGDTNIMLYPYQLHIYNNGTLQDLQKQADYFTEALQCRSH